MVSFPLCSESLHFKEEKNFKLDANETIGKDYRKNIKMTLAFVSTSFFKRFPVNNTVLHMHGPVSTGGITGIYRRYIPVIPVKYRFYW